MKWIAALAFLTAACAAAPPPQADDPAMSPLRAPTLTADRAGNRIEGLIRQGLRLCTADNVWCAPDQPANDENLAPWEYVIRRQNGHIMFGVIAQTSDMYSGGDAWMRVLTLYDVAPRSEEATAVLSLPMSGSASIRACFGNEDMRARRGACLDEYAFAGSINIDPSNTGPWPQFIFETEAQTYPGPRSRSEDSSEAPPLNRADLMWARDERCSYRRVLVYSEGAGGYAPNAPLPDCPDYFTQ